MLLSHIGMRHLHKRFHVLQSQSILYYHYIRSIYKANGMQRKAGPREIEVTCLILGLGLF